MGSEKRPFGVLAEAILDEILSWNPSLATELGWHRYDSVLPDPSGRQRHAEVARLHELSATLEKYQDSELSPDEAIDKDLAQYLLKLMLFEREVLKLEERHFKAYDEIGQSLFFLVFREQPPFESRLTAIIGRLEAAPNYIRESRTNLRSPNRLWIEASLETGESLLSFLDTLEDYARSRTQDSQVPERFESATAELRKEISSTNMWLRQDILPRASDTCAVLPMEYERYLRLKSFGMTSDEALEIAELYLNQTRNQMNDLAGRIIGKARMEDAVSAMRSDHPADREDVLEEYRDSVARSREFLIAKGLATIPQGEKLLVMETPSFMEPHTPYAAQYAPARFDSDRSGLFLVTASDEQEGLLQEHNRSTIHNTAVHEGYPGHHLQGVCSNTVGSNIRSLVSSPDFAEGWALYTEGLMIEQGFNATDLGRLAVLNDLRYRIVRLVADMRLARREMTIEEASNMLSRECGTDPRIARIEVRSCSMSPTYFSSYFLGKLALLQLLEEVKQAMGSKFSLRFLHDALLYEGTMPMAFMRRAVSKRLKEVHGIELGAPKESLYDYAKRTLGTMK